MSLYAQALSAVHPASNPASKKTQLLSAYHEAAHLVVAVYNGIEVFGDVSNGDSPDGTSGRCGIMRVPILGLDPDEYVLRLVTTYLAGDVPEQRLRPWRDDGDRGDDHDLRRATALLDETYPGDWARFIGVMGLGRRRARDQVGRLFRQIECVAAELLVHRALDAEDLRAYVYTLWTEADLKRLARRTGEPLALLLAYHDHPEPLVPPVR